MRDFTVVAYRTLLDAFLAAGYRCLPYCEYHGMELRPTKFAILRHDVDKYPERSLQIARIQHSRGVVGTYYFRIVPESFVPSIIREIASLGHEIGYHYEDLALARGDTVQALVLFEQHLARLRDVSPVVTACMHGSPMTRWDNRDIWKITNYRQFGIIAEPYLDIDFADVVYVTDTGRGWNKPGVSVRDKVVGSRPLDVGSTAEFAAMVRSGAAPDRMMLNIHPQRWVDGYLQWTLEVAAQVVKNQVKRMLVRRNVADGY